MTDHLVNALPNENMETAEISNELYFFLSFIHILDMFMHFAFVTRQLPLTRLCIQTTKTSHSKVMTISKMQQPIFIVVHSVCYFQQTILQKLLFKSFLILVTSKNFLSFKITIKCSHTEINKIYTACEAFGKQLFW